MIILAVVLVAFLAYIFGFLLGLTIEFKPKIYKKQIKFEQQNTEIQKEYQNFLNYDGSVQQ